MGFHAIVPPPPFDRLIESIWDWDCPAPGHRLERILPTPGGGLIVNLLEDETRIYDDDLGCQRRPGAVVSGPYTRSFIIDTAEQVKVMGIVFRPGGAWPFFRERIDTLSNRDIGLEDLLGARAHGLRETLLNTPCAHQRLAVLQQWLLRRAPEAEPHPLVASALHRLIHQPDVTRISAIVSDSGLSAPRFGRLFQEHVGMGAKQYARMQRFRTVVTQVSRQARVEWALVAADCGFYDQPHLVREFRAFAGMTPGDYVRKRGEHANHVPIA
jgi:AraC-like DNA-binding protein